MNIIANMEKKSFQMSRKALGEDAPYIRYEGTLIPCLTGEMTQEAIGISQNFQIGDTEGLIVCLRGEFPGMQLPEPEKRETIELIEPGSDPEKLIVDRVRRGKGSEIVILQTMKDHG